ncbi:MAG: macro domain-containing protein [Cyanobacteria bacterium J06598_1]
MKVVLDTIVNSQVDATVNAEKPSLLGVSGVDRVIHSAASPELINEYRLLCGCNVEESKLTKGYLHLPE